MLTTIELAMVPTADTPGTCIYVHNAQRSYVFGRLPEGAQRAFGSRKISFGSTENIFLSGSVSWEQMGGLIGYLLSVGTNVGAAKESRKSDNEKRKQEGKKPLPEPRHQGIAVHGADNLCHVLAACRPVIFRQPVSVRSHESREDRRGAGVEGIEPDWQDDSFKVWRIPTRRVCSKSPPKRLHEEISNGATTGNSTSPTIPAKTRTNISEPDIASMVVERIMFTGSTKNSSVLLPRRLGDLRPEDAAVVVKNNVLMPYKRPSLSKDAALPDPEKKVWVFPEPGDETESRNPEGALTIVHHPLPRTAYGEISMSYIVKCHDRRGKFNVAAAKSLGVKVQDYKLLTAGQNAVGKNDMVVTPEMVLGDTQPGKGFIIADIATVEYLDAFMQRPEWENKELMEHICVVYWILGIGLASNARIQQFIHEHSQMRHIICAEDTSPNMITHPGSAAIQTKLMRIDPDRFPLPRFDNKVTFPAQSADSPIELGRAGKKLQLMPRLCFDDQAVAEFPDLMGAGQSLDDELLSLAEKARAEATEAGFLARIEEMEKDIPNRDAEIIPLGTGSSAPSKHRNVSGLLVRVPGIGNYLFDCGEGTMGQILRAFDTGETADVLRHLRCIVISHLHADHHLGAVSVIKAWYEQSLRDNNNTATLAISCIARYRDMLEELAQIEDIGFHRLRFPSCSGVGKKDREVTTAQDLEGDNFGLKSIKRIPVAHCWRSYGTELELTSGLRIAYSGDCRPSSAFAQACKGAHLLIHECTFADDKQDHAKAKKHSTMAEALGVAREMQARRTLLTHFSQRYTKADSLRQETVKGEEQSVLLAFDLMRVRLGDFQKAACYIPAVQKLLETLE